MEWVETTGKTIEEAKERALDQLGVADDDAEFEILEEPRAGLFGLMRGEARVRGRVRPTEVRPKQDRRRGSRRARAGTDAADGGAVGTVDEPVDDEADAAGGDTSERPARGTAKRPGDGGHGDGGRSRRGTGGDRGGVARGGEDREMADVVVEPAAVGAAAVTFIEGLVSAFGMTASADLTADGTDLEVRVDGDDLGLLIGPGGRTLLAIQDIARVAAQRRLGDHDTRLRVDIAGYRERRRQALERFAHAVAEQVIDTGSARSLEPMPSADRKVVHDTLTAIEGVASHSEGEEPYRRVVVTPA